MCKVLIFGGTTEGRILAEYCSENRIPAYVSVVSEYGRELLKEDLYVRPLTGPMDAGQMRAFIADEAIELVVDATHPYARNATENIKSACRDTGTAYLRYLRNTEDERENAGDELFSTPEEAAKWLEETKGNIFVTTGSNELAAFAGTEKLKHRIFARVLPSSFAVGKCEELGITGKHLICMQGPFTKEMNAAMLRQTNAAYLVTKETGKAGGFDEKLEAARECGVSVIIIGHPKETGSGMNQIYSQLSRFSVRGTPFERREVLLAGIGPGSEALMTQEVREAIRNSDFLIGAPRMLKAANGNRRRENCLPLRRLIWTLRWRRHCGSTMTGSAPSYCIPGTAVFTAEPENWRRGLRKPAAASGCCRVFLRSAILRPGLESPGMTPCLHRPMAVSLMRLRL